MTKQELEAERIIEMFYLCMPNKDVKLTSCGENTELIIKMEKLSAKQCALLHVNGLMNVCKQQDWNYWQEVKQIIESK